jgi:hypothetical protein
VVFLSCNLYSVTFFWIFSFLILTLTLTELYIRYIDYDKVSNLITSTPFDWNSSLTTSSSMWLLSFPQNTACRRSCSGKLENINSTMDRYRDKRAKWHRFNVETISCETLVMQLKSDVEMQIIQQKRRYYSHHSSSLMSRLLENIETT